MKLLHVIHSADPQGGGPIEGVRQLAMALANQLHEVEVVCLDNPTAAWLKSLPVPVHALGPASPGYGYCPRLIPWLTKHCHEYDAVIVDGLWQFTGLATWWVLRNTSIPYFVFTHGMLDPWFKQQYPLKHLKKWLYWPWAEYRVLRDARAVLFTSEDERRQARRSFWLYRCKEVVVKYGTAGWHGDAAAQQQGFLNHFPELSGKQSFLFLGRIHEKKGVELLIAAFHRLLSEAPNPAFHLILAGPADSAYAKRLKQRVQALGLNDRITWTGMLDPDLKWGALQAADAFVLTSHQENFCIAAAEALSASRPVLITNKVNIWREIKESKAGLVEPDDAEGAYSLLKQWAVMGEKARTAMRENARKCFLNQFEISAAAAGLLELYKGTKQGASVRGTPPV